nr:MAG TPA: tail protein [Caudoviricetes sp.]
MKLYNTRMGLIDIKNISGDIRFSTDFNVGSIGRYSLGKEDYITLPFNVLTPISFKMGDYVDLSGILDESLGGKFAKIYEVVDLPTPTYDQSTGGYNYELRLDAYYWKWKNKKFKYMPEVAGQEASWNLTASLDMQLGVFLRNLQALGYKYRGNDFDFSIDSSVEDSAKLMSYENTNLLDALTNMAETWNCEWWVEDNIIRFGRCENGDAVRIELGVEAQEMPRSESQGTYATRVYAFGSTRNIPSNYRPVDETVVVNGIVQKRLMLPEGTPYIDAYRYKDGKRVYIGEEGYDIGTEMPQEEAIEDIIFLDEVYPRTECVVGTVGSYTSTIEDEETQETVTQTFYYVTDTSGLVFDKSYIIDGEELRLVFQSGLLNGMDFGVTFHKAGTSLGSVTLESDVYEIVANDNYGRTLPDETLKPTTGDKFILYGWDSTKITDLGLVSNAEQELRDKTVDCVKKMMVDDGTYNTTLASSWVKENMISRTFDIGQRIELVNKSFFETSRISRVIGLEIKLDLPYDAPVYTIGESTAYSRIGELENKVDNLTYKGQTYTSGGRKGVYIIRTNDSTAPSNSNVFSALRSLAMFLRKDIADTANELITFLKGLLIGKNGSGITVLEDGTSQAVVDRLYVKIKAVFDELEVKKKTHVGGEQILSPAGMKCVRVEELDESYRCFFLSEVDGITINNEFTVGTLALAQEFNIKEGTSHDVSNRYYWREVTGVGSDYIDLSKTNADKDSDIPVAGDDIIGLGHLTDITRQAAIILSSVNETSPSIIFYQGINSFALAGKEVIGLGFDKSTGHAYINVYGDAYIGAKDESTYIRYTQKGGVDIKGMFHIEKGSTGWRNMEGLPDEIQAAADLAQEAKDAIDNAAVGSVNLLRNSGFTGDYETEDLSAATELSADTELFSKQLEYWTGVATVSADSDAGSGYSAAIGSLSQSVSLIKGESYVISYKAKGTSVSVSCGSFSVSQPLTSSYQRYTHKITFNGSGIFLISGTATVCDLQLERGTIATDWKPSILDNDKATAGFQSINYIASAIKDGSVDILGGLILANMIQLGNYKNGKLQKVTAGVSGIYNDDDDVAFWAGGKLEQAILTVMRFRNDPNYQPTDTEWANMANFVATHGGDVFLRGYIYALGGKFRGEVNAESGIFKNVKSPNGNFKIDEDGNIWIKGEGEFSGTVNVISSNGYKIVISPEDEYSVPSIRMYDYNEEELFSISLQYGLGGMIPSISMFDPSSSDRLYFRPDSMVAEQKGSDGYIYQTQIMGGRIIMVKGSEIVWDQNQLPK